MNGRYLTRTPNRKKQEKVLSELPYDLPTFSTIYGFYGASAINCNKWPNPVTHPTSLEIVQSQNMGLTCSNQNYARNKSKSASLSVKCVNKSAMFKRTDPLRVPLITTDGYKIYEHTFHTYFGEFLFAQTIKTLRNDRVTIVNRRMIIGKEWFNLTKQQSTSFLKGRTTCFARFEEFLEKQLDIIRCHFNILRPP